MQGVSTVSKISQAHRFGRRSRSGPQKKQLVLMRGNFPEMSPKFDNFLVFVIIIDRFARIL